MKLDEDGPICDFCDLMADEGESLEPIYVGELPQPKPHYLSEVKQKSDNYHLLGKPTGIYIAMYKALKNCNDIDLNISEAVYEPVDDNVNHDKVGVELCIRPKDVTYEPDAMLCPNCAEKFRNL